MKVSDLLNKLHKMPPDIEVKVQLCFREAEVTDINLHYGTYEPLHTVLEYKNICQDKGE